MQPKRFQTESHLACAAEQVTHARDQLSTERIIGVVLWTALVVVFICIGAS